MTKGLARQPRAPSNCGRILSGLILLVSSSSLAQAPLTLRTVLATVARDDPALLAVASRSRGVEAARSTARAFGNPTLTYQVDQTPFPGGRPIPSLEREAMTTLTLPLEPLYQHSSRVTRADAEARAAAADLAVGRQRIALDAASAFYRVALDQVQADVARDLSNWLDSLVAYNRNRVNEGATAEVDLIRATVERDRIAAELAMDEADLAIARGALSAHLGNPRDLVVVADERPFIGTLMSTLIGPRSSDSLVSRPEVRAARERLSAANAAVSVESSMLVRQLGATIGTMQSGRTTSMIAGFSVPLPIFDANRGEVRRAGAERDAARFDLTTAERAARGERAAARIATTSLTNQLSRLANTDSTGMLARADEARRIAFAAYREGAAPLIQVIDAARARADARLIYYRLLYAQHQSVLTLLAAEGIDVLTAVEAQSLSGDAR
jgi:outer membrane protein, heavy metal efflux system